MQINGHLKCTITFLAALILSACTSTRDRFPEFSETAKQHTELPVVLDVFMYRDIAGASRGVNSQVSEDSMAAAAAKVDEILTNRGYSVKLVRTFNGLSYEYQESANYVISEGWRSTGQTYTPLKLDQGDDPWLTTPTSAFFKQMIKVAREIDAKKERHQNVVEDEFTQAALTTVDQIPLKLNAHILPEGVFSDATDNVLIYMAVRGRFQQLSKFLAKGILVGGVSNALTGGLVMVPSGSFAYVDIIAFDTQKRQILWHARGYAEGKNSVPVALTSALRHYPYQDGETHFDKERRRKRELLKKHR